MIVGNNLGNSWRKPESAHKQGCEFVTHLAEGQEVDAIPRWVLRNKAYLLVIGTHFHCTGE